MTVPETTSRYSLASLLVFTLAAAVFAFLMFKYGVDKVGPWAILSLIVFALFVEFSRVAQSANAAAANDPKSPTVIDTFKDDHDASIVVGRLRANGVNAVAVGGYTSGFQVEAPGYVDVVVPRSEMEQAKQLLSGDDAEADT